ncbi:MAG: iron-sulfur cluster assembly protein, partial [Chloroflexi bacterium]
MVERDLAQEGDVHPLGERLGAAVAEDLGPFPAVRAEEVAHVLDQAEVWNLERVEHLDGPTDVGGRDILRGGYDDRPRHRDALGHGELHVAGSWRQVDDQVVELAPVDVEQELADGPGQHRPAPDGRLVRFYEEAQGDHLDPIALDGNDLLVLRHRLLVLGPEQDRDVRAVDVRVQDPGASPELNRGMVELKMIKDITVLDPQTIGLTVVLTTPACPLKNRIHDDIDAALAVLPGSPKAQIK